MLEFNHAKVVAKCDSDQAAMKAASAGSEQSINAALDRIQHNFVLELNLITASCREVLNAEEKKRGADPLAYDDELVLRHRGELLSAKTTTEGQHAQERNGLVSSRQAKFLELNSFKAKNSLVGDAVEAGNFALFAGIFFILLLGETLINGGFFAQTNDRGLLGGAGQAFVFSFINILMAFLFAFWIRYINHNRLTPQILGYSGVICYIAATVLYNCFVGHYRNVLEANLEIEISGLLVSDASVLALNNFTDNGLAGALAVGDVTSVTLVLIGIILSIFALYKTYSYGDVYPGYAAKQKRFSVAVSKLTSFRNSREQPDLAEVFDESIEKLTVDKVDAQTRITDFRLSLTSSRMDIERLDQQIEEAKSGLKGEINKFELAYQQHSATNLPKGIEKGEYVTNLAPSTLKPKPDFGPHEKKFREGEPLVTKLISAISVEIIDRYEEKEKALKALQTDWSKSDQVYMNSSVFLREAEANNNG